MFIQKGINSALVTFCRVFLFSYVSNDARWSLLASVGMMPHPQPCPLGNSLLYDIDASLSLSLSANDVCTSVTDTARGNLYLITNEANLCRISVLQE